MVKTTVPPKKATSLPPKKIAKQEEIEDEDEVEEDEDDSFEDGDDSLAINMDEVEAQSFDLLPKAIYDVVLEELEYKLSQSSNQPMWVMTLVVTDGDYINRKLWHNMSFSPGALPGTKAALARIAPEFAQGAINPKKIADTGKLIGKTFRVKVKHEAYQGEDRAKVASFLPGKGEDDGEFAAA